MDKSSQGSFVNQSRVGWGESVTLNADDVIGVGCGDGASSRQEGRETFVYRLRPPEAFKDLVSRDNVELDLSVFLQLGNFCWSRPP